jgi:hypothetical protein
VGVLLHSAMFFTDIRVNPQVIVVLIAMCADAAVSETRQNPGRSRARSPFPNHPKCEFQAETEPLEQTAGGYTV